MESVKQEIILSLQKSIKELTGLGILPKLEHPVDERHGDYSSNVALTLFANSKLKTQNSKVRTPMDLAKEIASSIQRLAPSSIEKVEAVAPGFINFWLSKEYLIDQLSLISKTPLLPIQSGFAGRRIMVEFTDPNPFKEFHIGHLYSNTVGEAICRLLESQGALVLRACYQGDVGLHIAKSLYGILQLCHAELISASQILENEILKPASPAKRGERVQDDNLDKRVKFLGEAYAFGTKAYDEDKKAKTEIEKLNKKIYDKDPAIMALYEKGRQWSLEYFDKIYQRLGTKFKQFYFESEAGNVGLEIVKRNIGKIFQESKGAIIFRGEKFGLHNRVFINSLGLPTYEAKDLGLAHTKYKDFAYDLSIIITAQEQSDYFSVVLKALSLIEVDLAKKTKHIAHGAVRLPMGKMSSRTGTIILGEWLINEARRRIVSKYKEMDQDTAEKVAVGAVKYALLKSGIGRDIAFDFDQSISLEGNSGPYLQYTFARTQSVLAKAGIRNYELRIMNLKLEPEESAILRSLYRFPEIVEEAVDLPAMQDGKALQAGKFAPNLLCNYLFDLAQKFNLFYQKVPILEVRSKVRPCTPARSHLAQEFRLALTSAVGQVIKNGLYLLGISAPTKM